MTNQLVSSLKETITSVGKEFLGHIPYLIGGLIVLLFVWILSIILNKILSRVLIKTQLRYSLQQLTKRFVSIGIWAAGFLMAAMVVFPGMTPTKALGALGIASIAIGFAFKDIFENFFAGVLLLWRFPFENGDFIECSDIEGKVEDVTIRMTKIRLTTGELVVMPNSVLFKNPVKVLTNRNKRRISIITGIAYGEDVKEAVNVIEKALGECRTVDTGRSVQVFPTGFGSSSIDIEVTWWTDPTPLDIRRSKGEVVTAVKYALDNAGIEIPFPYRTLTFKEPVEFFQKAS